MSLNTFFNPESIAIIGASTNIKVINGKPLHYLTRHGYKGEVYPINPKYDEINGIKCYPDLASTPGPVDLVLIAVNYRLVLQMLEQCSKKGVPYVTIFSSGFAEAGDEGRKMQQRVADFARKNGIRICGPNCQGSVNLIENVASAFSAALDPVPFKKGGVGFVTQSGALGYSIFNLAQENRVGFSYIVSTGNEMDLNSMDYMEFMINDPKTEMVFSYLEGLEDGKRFVELADRALIAGKPIAVLKVGKSEVGMRAAASHTAALTGSDDVFDAFTKQYGVIRVGGIEEFIDVAKVMMGIGEIPKGNRLAIVSISGGGGVICADTAAECGLKIIELKEATVETIRENIPPFGSPYNPVDITAQAINTADGFSNVTSAVLEDENVDALVVVITNIVGEPGKRIAEDLVKAGAATEKPIVVAWTAGKELMKDQFAILDEANFPWFHSPAKAVQVLSGAMRYGSLRQSRLVQRNNEQNNAADINNIPQEAEKILNEFRSGSLSEKQSKDLLSVFEIDTGRETVATTITNAIDVAEKVGYPLVMKIDSPDILHKTEADAIRLNISNENDMTRAFEEIMSNSKFYNAEAKLNGVLMQEMISEGVEVIVGVKNDPQFGPVIMFGLGGIFVEVLKDVSLRLTPVSQSEALSMIKEVRGYKLLCGARGKKKADIDALADLLVKVSKMAVLLKSRLQELDLNPVIVLPEGQGAKVADALAILKSEKA